VSTVPVLASTLGNVFKPLYEAMAWLIAFFYRIVPNYAFAIAMLTLVVMAVTAPLTIKSTKSMSAMQRLGPELKKLQQKYKGDKTKLNEEMMSLYKEHGVNPAGGCLPMLLQFPVFIVLYGVIRGLTNTVKRGQPIPYGTGTCHQMVCAVPRYISQSAQLYHDLVKSHGQMMAFGIDLSNKALGHHGSVASAIPYWGLVAFAIGLQWLQMHQLNSRNPQYAQSNPQAAALQRYMPIIFGFIYLTIAAGVNIYFIVSSLCRIGIQEGVFRSGVLDRKPTPAEGVLPGRAGGGGGAPKRRTLMDRLADAQARALEAQKAQQDQSERRSALESETGRGAIGSGSPKPKGATPKGGKPTGAKPVGGNGSGADGSDRSDQPAATSDKAKRTSPGGNGSGGNGSGGKPRGGSGNAANGSKSSGTGGSAGDSSSPEAGPKNQHPRSKAKRTRKAR
jgi:YidC/Oxa1 family membrane protein insertase